MLDFLIQSFTKAVKSFIKDTHDFLRKMKGLPKNTVLCTVNVVGLYSIICQEERLSSSRKYLDLKTEKEILTDTLVELAEIV